MPKVAIALLTYKRPQLFKIAMDAILVQNFKDFELIILDNGSETDEVEKIAKCSNDNRIRYVRNFKNEREFYNYALYIAQSEYLVITHDDDIMHPDMIFEEVKVLDNNPRAVCVSANMKGIDYVGNVITERIFTGKNNVTLKQNQYLSFFLEGNSFFTPTVMFRIDYFRRKTLFFEHKLGPICDQYLWYKILEDNVEIIFLSEVLYSYRLHKGQDSVLMGEVMNLEIFLIWFRETYVKRQLYKSERHKILGKIFYYAPIIALECKSIHERRELLKKIINSLYGENIVTKIKLSFIVLLPNLSEMIKKVFRKMKIILGLYKG
jgi:glycosyltransferase involved in cell wall biosynthesis